MESKKRNKVIAEWIGRPFKPPSRNEDKEDEEKEEYVGAPLDSTEDRSPGTKYDEGCEDDWDKDGIYDREYTVLCDAEDNEEETSSGHNGEFLFSKSSEGSDDEDKEDDGTGAEDINGNGDGNSNGDGDGGGVKNTDSGGGSTEHLRFLSPGAQTEALVTMAKAKSSSLTASKKNDAGKK